MDASKFRWENLIVVHSIPQTFCRMQPLEVSYTLEKQLLFMKSLAFQKIGSYDVVSVSTKALVVRL